MRPAFSFTINKSQGQTLRQVGVWLMDPVFSHGQAYVAASRVGSHTNIKLALPYKQREEPKTRNVVFKEVFQDTWNQLQPNSQQIPSEINFPEQDYFPGDWSIYDIDCSNHLENERPTKKRNPVTTHKRSCSPAKNVAPLPETTPRLPVVSAKPQCDYERIRLKNIQEREELWKSLNQIDVELIQAGGEVDWAALLDRYRKKKNRENKFKEEVDKFISTEKQGWAGTNQFRLEDLQNYLFLNNSTFSQVNYCRIKHDTLFICFFRRRSLTG